LNRRLYWLALMFLVVAAAALAVDVPITKFCRQERVPGLVRELLSFAEVFGHGLGAACILLTAFVLDVGQRRRLIRTAVSVVGAGLVANLVKLAVGRMRPRASTVDHIWDSFTGWFPRFLRSYLGQLHRLVPQVPDRCAAGGEFQRFRIISVGAYDCGYRAGDRAFDALSTRPVAFRLFRRLGRVAASGEPCSLRE